MVQSAFRRGRKPLSAADSGTIYAFLRPKVPVQNGDARVLQNSPDNSIVVNEMANGQLPLRNDCVATPPKRRKKKKEAESGQSSGKDDCVATPPKRRKKKTEATESGQSSDKDDFVSTPKKMRKKRESPAKKEGQSPARRASKKVQKKLDDDCGTSRNLEMVIQAECYDLRKESRSVDEKYALLSAGKPVHPFFLLQKSSEQSNTQTETPIDPDNLLYPSPPFHVIQNIENIDVKVEWNGIFRKTSIEPRSSKDEEVHSSALISRDNISAFLVSSLDCLSTRNPLEFADMIDFLQMSSDEVSCVGASLEQLKETHAWYRARGISEMNPNSLWTDLYQPQSSQQVCGNKSSVNALNEWLSCWKMKADSDNRSEILPLENNRLINDNDRGWFQDDSDREVSLIDDDELENTLLLTGPVGSGKTAALYACAKEQGFHVIEINASDCRSGTIIKHKFGEASESQALIWHDKSYLSQIPKGKTTLILFEEVDTVFEEDRGFVSAIVHLAKTAKRPIVLTSNRGQLQLPQLKRIEIRFVKPTVKDMVIHACMVCNANGLSGDPWLMKRIVQACQQDLRKLTMLLQFWGQGIFQENNQDVKPGLANNGCLLNDSVQVLSATKRTEYSSKWLSQASWLFDSDAQFCLLPELLPLSFPCSISETVADRISQAVQEADKISSLAAEHSAEARAHQAETERMQKRKRRKTSDLVYQSTTSKVVLNFDLNELPPQEDVRFLETSPCKPQKLKRLKRCERKHEASNDYVPEKLATCEVPQIFSAEDITSRTQDAVQEEAVDLERIPPGQDVTQDKTVDLQSTQPGDGVDPVSMQWLELKNASLSCQCKSLHATALSFCDALEYVADKLSSCDVISTSTKDTEIAAQLAQGTLHHVLELCDETVRQSDAGTSYSVPWHQQNENRLQRHKMLEAIFYANPKTARLALTTNTFSDYISYMSRIVKLDDRHNIEFSRPRQRRSRGFQEDYLTQRHIPEAGIVALRQLFNFESSSH